MEVKFGNGTVTPDNNGAWKLFKGGLELTFIKPATIDRVVVLEFCRREHKLLELLDKLFDKLHSVAVERGIRLPPLDDKERFVPLKNVPPLADKLDIFMDKELGPYGRGLGPTDLLFAVLPEKHDRGGPLYEKLKGWCIAQGLPSQCLLVSTVHGPFPCLPAQSAVRCLSPTCVVRPTSSADQESNGWWSQ